jgi:two-component system response regulator FixJ
LYDPPVIAVIEDDEAMREAFCDLLQVLGLPCRAYDRAETFLETSGSDAFGCLITDVQLPGISGLELLQRLNKQGSVMPVIIVTSHMDAELRSRAMAGGAHAYLTKPLADDVLLDRLKSALHCADLPGERGEA